MKKSVAYASAEGARDFDAKELRLQAVEATPDSSHWMAPVVLWTCLAGSSLHPFDAHAAEPAATPLSEPSASIADEPHRRQAEQVLMNLQAAAYAKGHSCEFQADSLAINLDTTADLDQQYAAADLVRDQAALYAAGGLTLPRTH